MLQIFGPKSKQGSILKVGQSCDRASCCLEGGRGGHLEGMKNTKEGDDDEEEEEEEDKEDFESDELTVEEEMEIQRRWAPTSNELVFTRLRLMILSYKGTETYLICFTKRLAVEPRAGFNSEREGWPGCTGV